MMEISQILLLRALKNYVKNEFFNLFRDYICKSLILKYIYFLVYGYKNKRNDMNSKLIYLIYRFKYF